MKRFEVTDAEGVVLGYFQVSDEATAGEIGAAREAAKTQLVAKRVAKRSTLTDLGKLGCSMCGALLPRGREFNDHMEGHNREYRLGEKLE